MVKELKREIRGEAKPVYQCEACGYAYEDKTWADKCQQYCEEHQACNLEITAHAVPIGKGHYHRPGTRRSSPSSKPMP